MSNQKAYVLDAAGLPCGVDQVGELYLGGLGVGWGYHRRPALTAEKFGPDPFAGRPGARMYRTGDLARLRGDGELELIGRVDQQVKVGGVRIELGEVQACLREHPGVADAVVVAVRDAAGHAQALAAYLVPARIEVVGSLPTNANGKVARDELARRAGAPPAAADGELVRAVAEVWREVLGLPAAPAGDASFAELGGGSLAAIQVAARLNRRFAADLTVADLVEADTIDRVAAVVAPRRGRSARPALRRRAER